MSDLSKHYALLLGLDDAWLVVDVDLQLEEQRVEILLQSVPGHRYCCSECGCERSLKDHAPERKWRHLDTMQFETTLRARLPRTDCPDCGVKTVTAPWADPHGRFTLMFEAFAIRVLQAAANVERARKLLGLTWHSVHEIMQRSVERGLQSREEEPVPHVGIDEKSFGKGQNYVSVMVDIDGSRVLEVSKDRTEKSCDELWDGLSKQQKDGVKSVSMDFWQAFLNSARKQVPNAEIVHDRFHISQYLGEAVDLVRRRENRELSAAGENVLKGTRQLWLFNSEKLNEDEYQLVQQAERSARKTARAWAIKEHFRWFWEYDKAGWARRFFDKWYNWAIRSRLKEIKSVAVMLKKHLKGLLSYFRYPVTNATNEGFNSRIQAIKSAARGFRSFQNYRIRILFYCGKLDLLPKLTH